MTEISHTSGGHPYSSRNKQHIHENTCMLEKRKTRIQSGATKENSIKVPSKNILLLGLAMLYKMTSLALKYSYILYIQTVKERIPLKRKILFVCFLFILYSQ